MQRSGDEAEFTAWVVARQHALLRTAYLLTGDHGAAEDLLQTALFKVALRWGRLRDGDPEAYLRTILYRDTVSRWRRRRREVLRADVPDGPQHPPVDSEERITLAHALATPAKQRAVLVLRYFEDLTEARTAEVLGVSIGTVKSQTHVALQRLRQNVPELTIPVGEKGGIS